ncbi:hypothetical protein [Sphingobacterium chuzhouense]|uniref:Uncharacterized protein n=1 Tax=Sphingobacterium chuzhouense TaxID=1742264 RepID=A0ABR7XV29_9SPHI|nr:hypothetical protein [Sphingobacterium chuzhouense]MBD1422882.1 hypothetical protein [Sphingobacterium chuzhouense]
MNIDIYDPKELLNVLINIESELEMAMNKHCPDSRFSIDVDPDKALESFLNRQDVKGNEVGFLSTQIALLHLRREVEKTKGVVVDTNNLRAWEDFHQRDNDKGNQKKVEEKAIAGLSIGTGLNYVMLAITLASIMIMGYFFLFN